MVVLRDKFRATFHKGVKSRKFGRGGNSLKKWCSDCDSKEDVCWEEKEICEWGSEEYTEGKNGDREEKQKCEKKDKTELMKGDHLDSVSSSHSSSSNIIESTAIHIKGSNLNSLSTHGDARNIKLVDSNWLVADQYTQEKIPPLRIHVLNEEQAISSDGSHGLPSTQLVLASDAQDVNDVLLRHCFEGDENMDTSQSQGERDSAINGPKWPNISLKFETEALQAQNEVAPVDCEVRWHSVSRKSGDETLQTQNAKDVASSELKCHSVPLNSGVSSLIEEQDVKKQEGREVEKTEEVIVVEDCGGEVMEDGDGINMVVEESVEIVVSSKRTVESNDVLEEHNSVMESSDEEKECSNGKEGIVRVENKKRDFENQDGIAKKKRRVVAEEDRDELIVKVENKNEVMRKNKLPVDNSNEGDKEPAVEEDENRDDSNNNPAPISERVMTLVEEEEGEDGSLQANTPKAEEEEEESICVVPDLDDGLMYEDTPVMHLTATDHTYKSRRKGTAQL